MIKDVIARGASLLDQHFRNQEWRLRIDLDTLDMASPYHCILGQLFETYGTALQELRFWEVPRFTQRNGFNHTWGVYSYEMLTQAWKAELLEMDDDELA